MLVHVSIKIQLKLRVKVLILIATNLVNIFSYLYMHLQRQTIGHYVCAQCCLHCCKSNQSLLNKYTPRAL